MDMDDSERWIAESEQFRGIRCYGSTKEHDLAKLADRAKDIMAERHDQGLEVSPKLEVIVYETLRKH